jgi:hypothetical protein
VCSQGCNAIVDISTFDIVGPRKDIKELNAKLGFDSQYDNITCSSIETLPSNTSKLNTIFGFVFLKSIKWCYK